MGADVTIRTKLPNRRPSLSVEVIQGPHVFTVTCGIDLRTGRIGECFGNSPKVTSDMSQLIGDACVLISIALQCGITLPEIAKSLHREPVLGCEDTTDQPASVIGRIVETLIQEQERLA